MISIKDVAAACGVSISTVSKALNDHKDVSQSKKEYIRQKAKEMGYSPNSSARTLKTNRSHNIGVLFVDGAQSGLTHDYFASVLDSVKSTAESRGYDLTFIISNRGGSRRMTYLEHSRYRRVDGVVIACVNFAEPEVVELMQSNIPTVTIDYTFNKTIAVLSNNMEGMSALTQYAVDMGHRRIAYLYGEDSVVTSNRLSGFYITMEKNGIKPHDEYIMEVKYRNIETAEEATRKLLDLKEPPTCIFYPDDFAAFGGINVMHEKGLRIPEDISIAGYDGIPISRMIEPRLTTIIQDTRLIGKKAAEKLISLIEKPRTTIIDQVVIDVTLCPGETIKKIN